MRITVVGAGPSGLGCAVELARENDVTVVDRLPVPGGETGWENPEIKSFVETAKELGVSFELGSMATHWDGKSLLIVSPLGTQKIDSDFLFYAGGIRPATSAEIGLTGDRPAGIFPATVALHLLESGVSLWRNAAVVGNGLWASETIEAITKLGGKCTSIVSDDTDIETTSRKITNASNFRALGTTRIESFECDVAEKTLSIECDAVILAGPAHPNRNVEGALTDFGTNHVFVQSTTLVTPKSRFEHGRIEARIWADARGDIT